jgi:SAM-dependent methyltransferase
MIDNTQRFTGRAELYDRYRERYPSGEILTRLRAWCGLTPDWLVADIGAGTGMLSKIFLDNGNRVVAIEPNLDMRKLMCAAFEGRPSASRLEVIDATAEVSTLPDASLDMVGVGRAFHWFDQERAVAEFRRILKPNGWVALFASDRDRDSTDPAFRAQIHAYEHMLSTLAVDYGHLRAGFRGYDQMDAFFDGELHQAKLPGICELDWPTFSGHAMSLSVVPHPGHPKYEAFQCELRRHFDLYARAGVLTIPTKSWITAARFRAR